MADIVIKLNTANVPAKSVIVVGDYQHVKNLSHTVPQERPPESATSMGISTRTQPSFKGGLVISQYEQTYDQEIFKRWNWGMIQEIAALVERSMVIVTLSGSAQTGTQIRAMYTST
jgi:hypothetical protein